MNNIMPRLVTLTANNKVLTGLRLLMEYARQKTLQPTVDIPTALKLVEVAKDAQDLPSFFPHGKWATIQAIQERIDKARNIDSDSNNFMRPPDE